MKTGDIRIYKTEKDETYYKQFDGDKVMLIEEDFSDGSFNFYRWLVRHCKSGVKFYANINELK